MASHSCWSSFTGTSGAIEGEDGSGDEDDDLQVPSLHYPINHFESWWIVITDMDDINTSIRSIKCITVTSSMVEGVLDVELLVERGRMMVML